MQLPELMRTGKAFTSSLHLLLMIIQQRLADGENELFHHHKVSIEQDEKLLETCPNQLKI